MQITRDVITDLWVLGEAGEASADSRALVAEFLASDPELSRKLREDAATRGLAPPALSLGPDHEAKMFSRVRGRLLGRTWLLTLAMMFSCFAFGRIVADTTWTASPRAFIVTAVIAAGFWIAFLVTLVRGLRHLPRLRAASPEGGRQKE